MSSRLSSQPLVLNTTYFTNEKLFLMSHMLEMGSVQIYTMMPEALAKATCECKLLIVYEALLMYKVNVSVLRTHCRARPEVF